MNLSVKIGNLELKNPVMGASGTFGFGREYTPAADKSGRSGTPRRSAPQK